MEADQVKYDLSIPIWVKAVLTPEEAAVLGGVDTKFIRAHGYLAKLGRSDFPCFFVGSHMKIHRELFIKWLADIAIDHKCYEAKLVREAVKKAMEPKKAGRPRKVRSAI